MEKSRTGVNRKIHNNSLTPVLDFLVQKIQVWEIKKSFSLSLPHFFIHYAIKSCLIIVAQCLHIPQRLLKSITIFLLMRWHTFIVATVR